MNIKGKGTHNIRSIAAILRNAAVPLLAVITVLSCGDAGGIGKEDPLYRDFWVIDNTKDYQTDPAAWYTIHARKKAVSSHAVVYVDVDRTEVTDAVAAALATEFDAVIYPRVTQYFAAHYDVDGNERVLLLVYDIRDDYYYDPAAGSYIGGYFYSIDYYSNESVQHYYPAMHSNESDLVYIDCNPQDLSATDAKRTIAHEFQHMVNFSNAIERNKEFTDTWIDEGLAEAANHRCYGWDTTRVDYYNDDDDNYLRDGHPLYYWDYTNSLPNYAKSYLFFQYLRIQSSSGWNVYKPIFASSYGDYRSIQAAMNADSTLNSWGSDDNERFKKLVLRWYAANALCLASGIFGYKNEVSITHKLYSATSVNDLKSGGGIVKSMGAEFSSPATNFIYLSVDSNGTVEDFTSPYSDQDYFIAVYNFYNVDDGGGGDSTLPVSSVINLTTQGTMVMKSLSRSTVSQKPHKIDMIVPKSLMDTLRK